MLGRRAQQIDYDVAINDDKYPSHWGVENRTIGHVGQSECQNERMMCGSQQETMLTFKELQQSRQLMIVGMSFAKNPQL